MARPFKEGLEYFPLDVDMGQDDKIFYIETKHGPVAFAVIVKLLMRIYKNSYYTHWTEKEHLMFSRQVNVDINTVLDIVNDCIEEGLFDKGIYSNQGVLTSKGIQGRYLAACTRRKQVEIDIRYLLVDAKNYPNMVIVSKKVVNASNNIKSEVVNVDINPHSEVVNAELSTQSKVKESKEKNIDIYSPSDVGKKQVRKTSKKGTQQPDKIMYAELVSMTEKEYNTLIDIHGEEDTLEMISILDNYKGANGKKYISDYRAILSWVVKRLKEDKEKEGRKNSHNRTIKIADF